MGYDRSGKEHCVYQEMQVHHSARVQTSVGRVKGKNLEEQLESVHNCCELFEDGLVVPKVSEDW